MFLKRDAVPDKYSWSAKVVDVGDQDNTISFEVSVLANKVHSGLAKRPCVFVFCNLILTYKHKYPCKV